MLDRFAMHGALEGSALAMVPSKQELLTWEMVAVIHQQRVQNEAGVVQQQ